MQEYYLCNDDYTANDVNISTNKKKYKQRNRKIKNSFIFEELLGEDIIEKLKRIK